MRIEDEYMDVLQNMELGIVQTYRSDPDLTDYDVTRALEAVMDVCKAEKIGREPQTASLSQRQKAVFGAVWAMCEWRLGREGAIRIADGDNAPSPEPKTPDEILLCLKRLLKSVQTWNRRAGSRGYLDFVVQYVQ